MNVWGARVRPPTVDRAVAAWLLNAGLMGGAERRFFERTVAPGQVVVDVGANQGIFTLLLSHLVGPHGRVVSLEPEPGLFAALDENCRVNAATNVTRIQAAAAGARSQGVLHCSRFNRGDNRLTASLAGASVPVAIVPLDDVVPSGEVNLVKIDVQGYELHVLQGMPAILERSRAISVLFECWPAGLRHAGHTPRELIDFFVARGFSLFELTGDGVRPVETCDVDRAAAGGWSWQDFLAVRT